MLDNLLAAVVYLGVGIALLILAAFVVDLLTPGRPVSQVVDGRSRRAAPVLAAAPGGRGAVLERRDRARRRPARPGSGDLHCDLDQRYDGVRRGPAVDRRVRAA